MSILIRCIVILTVVLSLALMAVSAYAAKTEPPRYAGEVASQESVVVVPVSTQPNVLASSTDVAQTPVEPRILGDVYTPTPTVIFSGV